MYESKFFDIGTSSQLFGGSGGLPVVGSNVAPVISKYSLVGIPTGSGMSSRQGQEIMVHGISLNGSVRLSSQASVMLPAMSGSWSGIFRFYVVADMQHNSADFNPALWPAGNFQTEVSKILDTSQPECLRFTNVANKKRFRILGQVAVVMNPRTKYLGGLTISPYSKNFSLDLSFDKPIRITYSSGAGATTDISSTNIFLVCDAVCDQNAAPSCTISMATRTLFVG